MDHCKLREEAFSYLIPTVQFCIIKVGMKMLSIGLVDDALHIAFRLNNQRLITLAGAYARKHRSPLLANVVEYHLEKENP